MSACLSTKEKVKEYKKCDVSSCLLAHWNLLETPMLHLKGKLKVITMSRLYKYDTEELSLGWR